MGGRARTALWWGTRRSKGLEREIQTFTSTVHKLGSRVTSLAGVDPELDLDPIALREALDVLRLEYDALVVAEEELRTQLAELQHSDDVIAQQRRRYEDLFLFAPDGYAITDPFGVVEETNGVMARMLNIQSLFLVGKPLASYVAEGDVARFRGFVSHVAERGGEELSLRLRPRYQSEVRVSVAATLLPGERREIFWRFRALAVEQEVSAYSPSRSLSGVNVLVIDDDHAQRDRITHVLRERGARVVPANGETAATAAEVEVYDVVIVKLGASVEEGAAVLRTVRGRPYVAALALCSDADAKTVAAVLASGFDLHLASPVSSAHLIEATHVALRRARR